MRYKHVVCVRLPALKFHMSVDYEEKTVIGYLEPGVEYCVMVSMVAFIKQKSAPVKYCAFTSPPRNNRSGTTTEDWVHALFLSVQPVETLFPKMKGPISARGV